MKKTLITIIVSGFAVIAMATTSFANQNGIIGGAVRGVGEAARGVVHGAEDIVDGAANTAEDIIRPGTHDANGRYITKDGIANRRIVESSGHHERPRVAGVTTTRNPATGVSAIPFAMTLGSIGVATMAAVAGRRR